MTLQLLPRRVLVWLPAAVLLTANASSAPTDAFAEAVAQYEAGDLTGARSAWLEIVNEQPSAAVYYNLGRLDHQLGAGPQAVLWYRRALDLAPDDPWAQENLDRLRKELGLPEPDSGHPFALLQSALPWAGWLIAAGLWVAVGLRWLTGRPRGWGLAVTALTLVGGYVAVQAAQRLIPAEAVLMTACDPQGTTVPAGSEVWVHRSARDQVWTAAGSFPCEGSEPVVVGSGELPPAPGAGSSPPLPSGSADVNAGA